MKAAAFLGEKLTLMLRRSPLFTPYTLFTLYSNALFSHRKATKALGYKTRSLRRTIRSMLQALGYGKKIKT